MLQFPAQMRQWPSSPLIQASTLLPVPATSQEDELLLAMAESDLEDKLNEIRKTNSNLVIIGKPTGDVKEEYDAEAEDDDADNVEESDGDVFDQETGPAPALGAACPGALRSLLPNLYACCSSRSPIVSYCHLDVFSYPTLLCYCLF